MRPRHFIGISVMVLLVIVSGANSKPASNPQLQQSGGGGSQVSVVQGGNTATVSAGGALKVDGSAVTQPVSGTFWQATQPVSGTFWQATQPVSGTVTANQGGSPWGTNQTQVNGVAVATGNGVVGTGVQRVAIASDNTAFSVNATVSGALPAGTNVIGIVKQMPIHGCAGNNLQDVTSVDVATGGGTAATAADTCVFYIYANNKTGSAVTLTIQDKSGTPIVYSTTFSIPPNSDVRRDFGGHKFLGGVQLIAGTASAINVITMGCQ